jgi:pyrrolidone-carboxylate peptidase
LPEKKEAKGEVLEPRVGVEDVVGVWKGRVGGADVRSSEDAGRYLCEYILHSSLGFLRGGGREGKCLFLHVPAAVAEADVERGRRVVLGLVEAVVEVGWEGKKEAVKVFVGGGSVREKVGV